MTDSPHSSSSLDDAPIDAEFEPAGRDDPQTGPGSNRPGWSAYFIVLASAFAALALSAATAGFVPGFKPGDRSVEEVRTKLSAVETDLASDRSETSGLSSDVATLQSRADSLSADRTRINGDIRSLRGEIEALQADISVLQRARVASLADQDAPQRSEIDTSQINALTNRVAAVEDALVAQLGTYDSTLELLKSRIAALEAEIASEERVAAGASNARTEAALALSAIEAAARRGRPFLTAQQRLATALPGNEAVNQLAPMASRTVLTIADLRAAFPPLVDQALDAAAATEGGNSGWMRGIFGDGIKVRRAGVQTSRDHLEHAQSALTAGELAEAIEHIRQTPETVQSVFTDWIDNAEQRTQLEQTLEALRLYMIAEDRP